jgi:peroxiredoxin
VELIVAALILTWVVLALVAGLAYQLMQHYGRLLLRVEALEHAGDQLDVAHEGLPVGTVVHDFELPTLDGGHVTRSQWLGRRLLLIFFSPRCSFCQDMLPDLAQLPAADEANGRPVPLILTTGDLDENRRLFAEYKVRCPVLLQEDMEVASLYHVAGTPMGYLIDEQGATAAALAVGADAVLTLAAGRVEADGGRPAASAHGNRRTTPAYGSALTQSHILRDGLPAGTTAPDFHLPRLDGGEISLADYRGRRVLLVFSDPDCGPCDDLAPTLEQIHRSSPQLQVFMVSRGEPEANRAKVAQHGLTFPIALQRRWEISRLYGMFATPIAYLIDEDGIIAADVAAGGEAIIALAARFGGALAEDGARS